MLLLRFVEPESSFLAVDGPLASPLLQSRDCRAAAATLLLSPGTAGQGSQQRMRTRGWDARPAAAAAATAPLATGAAALDAAPGAAISAATAAAADPAAGMASSPDNHCRVVTEVRQQAPDEVNAAGLDMWSAARMPGTSEHTAPAGAPRPASCKRAGVPAAAAETAKRQRMGWGQQAATSGVVRCLRQRWTRHPGPTRRRKVTSPAHSALALRGGEAKAAGGSCSTVPVGKSTSMQ